MINHEEIFKDIITDASHHDDHQVTCSCKRHYFVKYYNDDVASVYDDPEYIELKEKEYLELLEKSKNEPDKFIERYKISYITFNGTTFVVDCKCEWYKKYANFLFCEKDIIINFYKTLNKNVTKEAIDLNRQVSELIE